MRDIWKRYDGMKQAQLAIDRLSQVEGPRKRHFLRTGSHYIINICLCKPFGHGGYEVKVMSARRNVRRVHSPWEWGRGPEESDFVEGL
jgi:hypothetical protein